MFPTGRNRDAHINNTSFSFSSNLQLKPFNKMSQKDPCQKQACAIQKCLQANKYIESRCEDVIRDMKKCCEAHAGENSVCCSGFTKDIKSIKTTTTT